MRWHKLLRFAIALFVVAFAAVVVMSLRRGATGKRADPPAAKKLDPASIFQSAGAVEYTHQDKGKVEYSIKSGNQISYEDGRSKFGNGVTVLLPDRGGRRITIESHDADVAPVAPGKTIPATMVFTEALTPPPTSTSTM